MAGRCPVCGVHGATCGPEGLHTPIVIDDAEEEHSMSELREYDVDVNGRKTTLKLSDADAKKRGLTDSDTSKAATPKNKSRSASNK